MTDTLKNALKLRLNKLRINDKLKEYQALTIWDQVVGDKLSSQTSAQWIKDGKLYILVSSSVWAHQLAFYKKDYINKINRLVGENIVKDIFFQVGNPEKKKEIPLEETRKVKERDGFPDLPLDEAGKLMIGKMAEDIQDEEMRTAFIRLAERDRKVSLSKQKFGWKMCPTCGTLHDEDGLMCFFCANQAGVDAKEQLSKLLLEIPWINYAQAKESISDIKEEQYRLIRDDTASRLLKEIKDKIDQGNEENVNLLNEAMTYVMLITGLEPMNLDGVLMENKLGAPLFERIMDASRKI
jgi:hypothetical protein